MSATSTNSRRNSTGSGIEVCFFEHWRALAPRCAHGPMLLFERFDSGKIEKRRYYACSASRKRKFCDAFCWEDDHRKKIFKTNVNPNQTLNTARKGISKMEILALPSSERFFCHECQIVISSHDLIDNNHPCHTHKKRRNIPNHALRYPSRTLLAPLEEDKVNAQYYLKEKCTNFMMKLLQDLKFTHVVCIGMPTLHEAIEATSGGEGKAIKESLDSILLDIDERYEQFFGPDKYCKFNMFNSHFFGEGRKTFMKFLEMKNGKKRKCCIVLDPPFGGLVDAIGETLVSITGECHLNGKKEPTKLAPTLWIFPYFMEKRILERCPGFTMLDYEVDYENHKKFRNKPNTSRTSPVRIFTNIPQSSIILPEEDGYRFCQDCNRFVGANNLHCDICETCPSKNGKTYFHCKKCNTCTKPGRTHCDKCKRCELPNHTCGDSVHLIGCHICGKLTHRRRECPLSCLRGVPKPRFKHPVAKNKAECVLSDELPKFTVFHCKASHSKQTYFYRNMKKH